MNILSNLSAQQFRRAADIQEKIAALQDELSRYLGGSSVSRGPGRPRKSGMSAAGRARIAAAQRARWAKARAAKGPGSRLSKTKRTMSAAARAKIAAAARARWARAKAAGKRSL
jgi:hypothetical protein